MNTIRELVFKLFKDTDKTLVFPSEDSARYFLTEYVRTQAVAIKAARAIAFDTFRGLFLAKKEEMPVNSYYRTLYTNNYINEKLGLTYLLKNEYIESLSRMRPFIEKCLPILKDRADYKTEIKADLDIIYDSYTQFLKENNLFETGFEEFQEFNLTTEYVLLFPELIAGAEELITFLNHNKKVQIINTNELEEKEDKPLYEYENVKQEVKGLMRALLALKESGVALDEITISTPDLDMQLPLLISEAKLYDIPLTFVSGLPVLNTVPGSFLSKLLNLYDSEFSFESLEDLLLFEGYPWQNIEFNRAFVRLLVQKNARGGNIEYKADPILRALSRYNTQDEKAVLYLEFYKKLKAQVLSLFSCDEVENVYKTLNVFMATFFQPTQFYDGGENQDVYAFLLNELSTFVQAQKQLKLKIKSCFNLFLNCLKTKVYVPQNKGEGIKVYRFGMDVLIDTKYHFVIGLNDDLTKTVGQKAIFFEPYEVIVEENQKEVSNEYFSLYQKGSEYITFSYAKETYSGVVVASEYFVRRGLIKPAIKGSDAYCQAPLVVLGKKSEVTSLPLLAKSYLNASKTALSKISRIDDWSNENSFGQRVEKSKLSFSSIDRYLNCPYSYLINYGFKVADEKYLPQALDHALIGEKLHLIVERFFTEYPTLFADKKSEYENGMIKTFNSVMEEWKKESRAPDIYTEYWMQLYIAKLILLIDKVIEKFTHSTTTDLEMDLSFKSDEFSFYGRIDCVIELSDGTKALIDFKKGDASLKVKSIQLPLYKKFYLAKKGDEQVSLLSYYSFKDDKFADVKESEKLEEEAEKALNVVIEGTKQADWHAISSALNCKNCNYKSICRRRFSIV